MVLRRDTLRASQLAGYATATLVISSLVYVQSSIFSLLMPIAFSVFFSLQMKSLGELLRSVYTPFLPLILVLAGAAFFQETLTEAFDLLSVGAVYVVARFLGSVFRSEWLLFGVAFIGLLLGGIRQLSLTQLGELIPLLRKLAEVHERNPAGTALAFGVVALLILAWQLPHKPSSRLIWSLALFSGAVMMLFSDVMTAVLGAIAAAFTVSLLAVIAGSKKKILLGALRPKFWWFVLGGGVSGLGIVGLLNVVAANSSAQVIPQLERNFGNLTGRTEIWSCYFEVVSQHLPDPWLQTLACAGATHANLHNTFLQSHLVAGYLGMFAAIFAFAISLYLSTRKVFEAIDSNQLGQALSSVGFLTIGFVMALAESYLLVYLYPTLVVFLAAPNWNLPKQLHRFRTRA